MTPLFNCTLPITRSAMFDALRPVLSAPYYRKVRSLVGRALTASGYAEDSERDIRTVLTILDRLPTTREVAADAPSACRKVRALVLGRTGTERLVLPGGVSVLSAPWIDLLNFNAGDKKRRAQSRLQLLARSLEATGARDAAPAHMPSVEQIYRGAAEIGFSEKSVLNAIRIYRRLRHRAIDADPSNRARYAPLDDRRRVRGRNAVAVLRTDGVAEARDSMEAIRLLAPLLHTQLEKYSANPVVKGKLHQPSTVNANVAACSRLIASLHLHAPELLATFSIKELWKQLRPLEVEDGDQDVWDDEVDGPSDVPLARWIISRMAPSIRAKCAPSATDGYPSIVMADLKAWFSITEWALGAKYRERAPETWKTWRDRYCLLRKHVIEKQIPPEQLVQHKDKALIVKTFTLAHLYCVAIPLLFREAERLLDHLEREIAAWQSARPNADGPEPAAVRTARTAFEKSAEPALALGFIFFDGMRFTQYREGLYGKNFVPDIDPQTDEWFGVKTKWFGRRLAAARVKTGCDRARQLGPGQISMRVLRGYVEHVRVHRLVAAGVAHHDALSPNGKYPLFVTTNGGTGAWSDTHFSQELVGRPLFRIATVFFERAFGEIKSYEDFDRKLFYGVLGVHASRYVIATGCEVLLNDLDKATILTSDDAATLRDSYVVASWLPEGRVGTWQNALSYVPWLKQLVLPGATENPLDTLPPHLLPPAVQGLLARWKAEDREITRRVNRSTHGSPSGRLRGARPDVAARNRERARLARLRSLGVVDGLSVDGDRAA